MRQSLGNSLKIYNDQIELKHDCIVTGTFLLLLPTIIVMAWTDYSL